MSKFYENKRHDAGERDEDQRRQFEEFNDENVCLVMKKIIENQTIYSFECERRGNIEHKLNQSQKYQQKDLAKRERCRERQPSSSTIDRTKFRE